MWRSQTFPSVLCLVCVLGLQCQNAVMSYSKDYKTVMAQRGVSLDRFLSIHPFSAFSCVPSWYIAGKAGDVHWTACNAQTDCSQMLEHNPVFPWIWSYSFVQTDQDKALGALLSDRTVLQGTAPCTTCTFLLTSVYCWTTLSGVGPMKR